MWNELFKIEPKTDKQKMELGLAKDEINGYEKTTLYELQRSFE